MGAEAELVFVVGHIGSGGGVVGDTLSHRVREVELLELEVTGQQGVEHLVAGVVSIRDGQLGLRLLGEEVLVGQAGGGDTAQKQDAGKTQDVFVRFHIFIKF